MEQTIIEIGSEFLLKLVLLGITALFAWIEVKIGNNQNLRNVNDAKSEVKEAAEQTASALQQKFVNTWKEQAIDGKLTDEQIAKLAEDALILTVEKLSHATIKVLEGAGIDVTVYIKDSVEAWIDKRKNGVILSTVEGI